PMENAARSVLPKQVFQEYAPVVARAADGRLVVGAALGPVTAHRAASCLVDAEPGDTVLLAIDADGLAFVLAVLTRAPTEGAAKRGVTLEVEGDLQLRTRSGQVKIAAQEGVEIVTPTTVGVTAGALEVRAVTTSLVGQAVEVAATSL